MRILMILALGLSLSSCNKLSEYIQTVYSAATVVNSAIETGRAGIRDYCAGIGSSVNEAAVLQLVSSGGECKAVARTKAIIEANRAICNNVNTLTAGQIYNYGKKLATSWAAAKDAIISGC